MEFPLMKRILPLFFAVLIIVGVAFVVFRSGPSPTEEERKQLDVLTGQLFVFNGVTNEIREAQTIAEFDGQHEMVPYLRMITEYMESKNWNKDRPLRLTEYGNRLFVTFPLPPEVENKPIRWGPDYLYQVLIDKQKMTIVFTSQGS